MALIPLGFEAGEECGLVRMRRELYVPHVGLPPVVIFEVECPAAQHARCGEMWQRTSSGGKCGIGTGRGGEVGLGTEQMSFRCYIRGILPRSSTLHISGKLFGWHKGLALEGGHAVSGVLRLNLHPYVWQANGDDYF